MLPLVAGLIFEYRRICASWGAVLVTTLIAFACSFIAFFPLRSEREYSLDYHIQMWPYIYCLIFAFIAIVFHKKKITAKLTEGITLLQSLAIIYWIIDFGVYGWDNAFLRGLMLIGLLFSIFSIFHVFSNTVLSKSVRLTLSIWSSIIMIVFAVDNTYQVFQNEQIENITNTSDALYVALQYFLLGVSSIYMVQNILLIGAYFPGRDEFFNEAHFKTVSETNKKHIERYSKEQVSALHSFYCILFAAAIFGLNYYFELFSRNVTIWLVFVLVPILLHVSVKKLKDDAN
jgi:hypothetical protein